MHRLILVVLACLTVGCKNDDKFVLKPTKPIQLTFNTGKDEDPCVIQASDEIFYIVYFSDVGGNHDIWLTKSTNTHSWSEPEKIISHPGQDLYPQMIQAKDGTFYLTWFRIAFDEDLQEYTFHVWFAKSVDSKTWTNHQQLSEAASTFNWVPGIMEDDEGVLWVTYTSGRLDTNKEVYVIHSEDGGLTWDGSAGSPIRVTTNALADDFPNIHQRQDGTYSLVWTRYNSDFGDFNNTMENLLVTSEDGLVWSDPEAASPPDPSAVFTDVLPHLFKSDGGEEYIAWTTTRNSGTGDIFCAPVETVGQNLGVVELKNGFSYSPRVVSIEGTNMYLMVWVSTSNSETKPDIFYQVLTIE